MGHCPGLSVVQQCHHTPLATTLGSGLKGWVTVTPPPHPSPPPPVGPSSCPLQSLLYLLPDKTACAMLGPPSVSVAPHIVYLVIISLSIVCFLIRPERKLIFLCISELSVTLLSQPHISTTVFAHLTVRRPDHHNHSLLVLLLSCHKVYRFLF